MKNKSGSGETDMPIKLILFLIILAAVGIAAYFIVKKMSA
jgi:uncharacterized protein (UPF0333 family)